MATTLAHAPSAVSIPAQPTSSVATLYANLVSSILATTPQEIGLYAEAADIEDRAEHLDKVMSAAMAYVAAMVRDAAASSSVTIDWQYIAGCMDDYRGEAIGELNNAASNLWRLGC